MQSHSPLAMIILCLIALATFSPSLARLSKRNAPLETVLVPLTLDDKQRYTVSVNMSGGPDPQPFKFALSTSTGYSMVAGVNCDSCSDVSGYNESASISAVPESGVQNVAFLDGSASGTLVSENCSLIQRNGSAWVYPNQTIIVANQSSSVFSQDVSGIFGLGTNSRDGNFSDTVFGGWLSRNPSESAFTYGMALNPPRSSSKDGGILHWVAPDTSFYQGSVSRKDMLPSNATSVNADWTVQLDSLSFSDAALNISRQNNDLKAIVDPYFRNIYIPQSLAGSIYASIPGSQLQPKSSGSVSTAWAVPCDTKMSLTVEFGELFVTVNEDSLITNEGGLCLSILEEWNDANEVEYLFGASFISTIYLIFSVSGASQGSIGFAQRAPQKHKLSSGAIVGIVWGCVAAVGGVAVFLFLRYRSRKQSSEIRDEEKVDPFSLFRRAKERGETTLPGSIALELSPTSAHSFGDDQSYSQRVTHSSYTRYTPSSPYTPQSDTSLMTGSPSQGYRDLVGGHHHVLGDIDDPPPLYSTPEDQIVIVQRPLPTTPLETPDVRAFRERKMKHSK